MNRRPKNYNTKQSEAILAFMAGHKGQYLSAAQVVAHFLNGEDIISRPTIYRQLEKLVHENKIQKYTFNGTVGACFRYVDEPAGEQEMCHLKCESCNRIISLKCNEIDHISRHMLEAHAFQVNDYKTVFYGKCKMCQDFNGHDHDSNGPGR